MDLSSQGLYAQLQSQKLLIDRLQTQISFSSRLIWVAGAEGSGKSTIAKALLDTSDFSNQALIAGHALHDDADFRRSLLSQLLPGAVFNADDRLIDSLFRNLEFSSSPQLVIIDDVQRLSVEILDEIQELIRKYPERYEYSLCVILFSEFLIEQLNLARCWDPDYAIQMEVPELSRAESFALADLLFKRSGYQWHMENTAAVERLIEGACGNPKRIHQVVDNIVKGVDQMSETKPQRRPYWLIILVVLLVAAVTGLIYQTISDWQRGDTDEAADSNSIPVVLPTDKDRQALGTADSTLDPSDDLTEEGRLLPKPIDSDPVELSSPSTETTQRVILDDDVVNKIIEDQQESSEQQIDEPQTSELSPEVASSDEASVDPRKEAIQKKAEELQASIETAQQRLEQAQDRFEPTSEESSTIPTAPAVPARQVTLEPSSAPMAAYTLLKNKNPAHYTLQLGAYSSQRSAQSFANGLKPAEQVWVYKAKSGTRTLYKVVAGDFQSSNVAKQNQAQLKSAGQASLLKTFKQVQSELQP